jgi:DNA-binding NarL/FixJ family response regulator
MGRPSSVPELTSSEERLLPLLATMLSFDEIGRLLDLPRDAVQAEAIEIYRKLGLSPVAG